MLRYRSIVSDLPVETINHRNDKNAAITRSNHRNLTKISDRLKVNVIILTMFCGLNVERKLESCTRLKVMTNGDFGHRLEVMIIFFFNNLHLKFGSKTEISDIYLAITTFLR